jgi:hypothetical protein
MIRRARLPLLLGAACALLLSTAATAGAADANGTWKWTFSRNGQEVELVLELKQDGEKLSGTLNLPFGDGVKLDIQDGTFKNDEVDFKTVFERNGNSFETKYHGKVEGDTIKGKTERQRNGETMSRDWEAKREK